MSKSAEISDATLYQITDISDTRYFEADIYRHLRSVDIDTNL